MKKLKIYLETSTISHLDHYDMPDRMHDTHKLWNLIKMGAYNAVISRTVMEELGRCEEPKLTKLLDYLNEIEHELVSSDSSIVEIAEKFIDFGILKQKSFNDCMHISAAIVSGCDAIVSWNFEHIVNHKTMLGVKAVTALEGYDDLLIYTPTILIGGNDDE